MTAHEVTPWYLFVFEATRGMSATAAAQKAGIDQSAFIRWRRGQLPDPRIAVRFARAHGLNVLAALVAAEVITVEELGQGQAAFDISTNIFERTGEAIDEAGIGMKTPEGRWGQKHIATLLGIQETAWSKVLNGQLYPVRLQTLQKIEVVFGWPVSEQVQLIPMYWEWPVQANHGIPAGEPTDLRYAIKLARVVSEWGDANPRTVTGRDLTMHPGLRPLNRKAPATEATS